MQATFPVYPLTLHNLKHMVTVLLSQLQYTLGEGIEETVTSAVVCLC